MAEITAKSTKTEILEAYKAMKKAMDEKLAQKDDPVAEQMKKENQKVLETAKEVVGLEILNPTIVEKYENLCKAIEMKQAELKELYGIEVAANSLVALVNTYKDKENELAEKYRALTMDSVKTLEEKKAALNVEIAELEERKKNVLITTKTENQQLFEELKKTRAREEEEYEYGIKRARKVANDKWADEKAMREKEIATREKDLDSREKEIKEKEAYIKELELKVADIPVLQEKVLAEGVKKGKAEADKSNVFEVRALNTKHEYETKSLNDQIDRLSTALADEKLKNASLQQKLDEAYAQMKELASETVKSSGGVKILNGNQTPSGTGKN